MTADVSLRPPLASLGSILTGRPVRSPPWYDAALALNWAAGRGAQLVPEAYIGKTLQAAHIYRLAFYVRPTYPNLSRLWIMRAYGAASGVNLAVQDITPGGSGAARAVPLAGMPEVLRPIFYTAHRSAQSSALGNLVLSIQVDTESDAVLQTLQCVEVPRNRLALVGGDYGFDLGRTRPSAPIWADSGGDFGLHRLAEVAADPANVGRRASMFGWGVPYWDNGAETTAFAKSTVASSGTPDTMFGLAIPITRRPSLLDLSTGASRPTDVVLCAALVRAAVGTSGSVRFTATSGDSLTVSHTGAGTWNWITGLLETNTEDQDTADGLRGGAFDDVTIDWWRDSGSDPFYCAGINILEDIFAGTAGGGAVTWTLAEDPSTDWTLAEDPSTPWTT